MGLQSSKDAVVPKEKHAFVIGIRDYQDTEKRFGYKSLTNPAQNAFQMAKFFRKHEYNDVVSNIIDYNDVIGKKARASFETDLMP